MMSHFFVTSFAIASPGTMTFQSRIINPDGSALEAPAVNFRFEYYSHDNACLLYVEQFTNVSMTASKGLVSLQLGGGSRTLPSSGGATVASIFDNTPITNHECQPAAGIFYSNVTSSSRRNLVVKFDDQTGSGQQTLSGISINSVPYAWYAGTASTAGTATTANSLGGILAVNYLKFSDFSGTCGPGEFLQYDALGSPNKFTCATPVTSGGTVTSVTSAGLPIVIGGTAAAPTISITQANGTTSGYISSADYTLFNSKQNALGFTPLNPANNLSDLANAATARTNLGLGGAAQLDVTVGGDLTGSLPNPTVATVGGKTQTEIATAVDDTIAATANNTINTIVKRDASGSVTVGTLNAGTVSGTNVTSTNATTRNLYLYDLAGVNRILFKAPDTGITNYTLTLPATLGTNGQVLSTNATGELSWSNVSGGTITSITAGTGLNGGTITTSGTIDLANTSVVAGTYGSASKVSTFTVDAQGRLTAASSSDISIAQSQVTNLVSDLANKQASGNYVTTLSGDVTSSGFSSGTVTTTIANDAITSTKILDGTITNADINAAAAIDATKINTGIISNTEFNYLDGVTSNIQTQIDSKLSNFSSMTSTDVTTALGSNPVQTATSANGIRGTNVNITSLTTNDILQYNGTDFINRNIPSCGANQYLTFNGAVYSCATDVGASGTVGSLNGLTGALNIVNGSAGTDFNINSSAMTVTLNLPTSSVSNRGLLSSADYTTFSNKQNALGFTPLNPSNNLSELTNFTTARSNLGLGSASLLNSNQVVLISNMPASCGAGETLTFSSPTGAWVCSNIVMANNTITNAMISSVDWTKVSNTPTTAAGYNIPQSNASTDGYLSSSDFTTFSNKQNSSARLSEIAGLSPSVNQIIKWNGSAWVASADNTGNSGTITSITAGTGLNGGTITTSGTIDLANTSVVPGTYGSASKVSTFTVDAQGRLTAAASSDISIAQSQVTNLVSDLATMTANISGKQNALGFTPLNPVNNLSDVANATTARSNLGLGNSATLNVGTIAGTVAAGDDARFASALQSGATASGDLTGTYPNPTIANDAIISTKILDGTITNADINAAAAIDATKINTGVVSNTEFNYLDGVSSNIQTQLNSKLSNFSTMTSLDVTTALGSVPVQNATTAVNFSGSLSGDISGTQSSVTVDKIKNTPLLITSLTANDILQYNGTNYVNRNIPTCLANEYLTFNGTTYSCATDAGSVGAIASVNVTAPVLNTGTATNPIIAMNPSSTTVSGYLSSSDFTTFNSKQNALGYTPLNPSNNLSELTNFTTARSNLGLGSASLLNSNQVVLISNMPANCGSGETLTFSSPTGAWVCSTINLANNSVTNAMISSVDWTKVQNTPTTAAGYNIPQSNASTDGYLSSSDFTTFSNKQNSSARLSEIAALSPAIDQIIKWNGSSWIASADNSGNSGTVTSITAGTGLNGGTITSTGTIDLANTSVTAGIYGSASKVSTFTVDAQGRLTAASSTDISIAQSQVTNLVTDLAGKQASGNYVTTLSGDVTSSGFSSGTVTTTIANDAITNAKILNGTIDLTTKVTGALPVTSGGTGNSTYAVGDLLYADTTTSLSRLPASTSGYVLTSNGAGTAPSWSAATTGLPAAVGSASLPGYSFVGDTNTGMFGAAADTLGFSTNGTEKMRINSSGNVGIGTANPTVALDVNSGVIRSRGNGSLLVIKGDTFTPNVPTSDAVATFDKESGPVAINLFTSGSNTASIYFGDTSSISNGAIKYSVNSSTPTNQKIDFLVNGSSRATINGSGNVGIGTTSPTTNLDIQSSTANVTSQIKATAASLDSNLVISRLAGATGRINYQTNGLSRWSIVTDSVAESGSNVGSDFGIYNFNDAGTYVSTPFMIQRSSGYVGIGTTTPTSKLHVEESTARASFTGTAAGTAIIRNIAGSSNYTALDFGNNGSALAQSRIASYQTGGGTYLSMGTTNNYASGITNQAVTIDPAGNVGIGTTAPTAKLEVSGGIKPGNVTTGAACTPEGAFAYDISAHVPVYCNVSLVWAQIGGVKQFGGTFETSNSTCYTPNTLTGSCTCPSGYTARETARGGYYISAPWDTYFIGYTCEK